MTATQILHAAEAQSSALAGTTDNLTGTDASGVGGAKGSEVGTVENLVLQWRFLSRHLMRNVILLASFGAVTAFVGVSEHLGVLTALAATLSIVLGGFVVVDCYSTYRHLARSWSLEFIIPIQRLLKTINMLEAQQLELLPEEKRNSFTSEHQRKLMDIARNVLEHQRFVDQVVDNMFEMMFVLNADGVILQANKSACDTTKYQKNELVGQHIRKLFPHAESLVDYFLELEIQFTTLGEVRDMDVHIQTSEGEILPFSINGVKVESSGGDLLGYNLILKNMSEVFRLINALNKSNFDLNRAHNELEKRYDQIKKEVEAKEGQRRILEHELATSQLVQNTFLPQKAPEHPKVTTAGTSLPAAFCGGDWWNCFSCGEKFFVFIGDVTGHGTASAMVTAAISGYYVSVRNSLQAGAALDVDTILEGFDSVLADMANETVSYNMTCFAGVIDFEKKTLRYANAGHNFPLVIRKGSTKLEPLLVTGNRLGNKGPDPYPTGEISLQGGELVFLYTDGLIENKSTQEEPWGKRRLKKFLEAHSEKTPDNVVQVLMKESSEFFAHGKAIEDDVTIVAIRVTDSL